MIKRKLKHFYARSYLNILLCISLTMLLNILRCTCNHENILCSILGEGYPCFELSAVNADKPPLTVSKIKERVSQFENLGED